MYKNTTVQPRVDWKSKLFSNFKWHQKYVGTFVWVIYCYPTDISVRKKMWNQDVTNLRKQQNVETKSKASSPKSKINCFKIWKFVSMYQIGWVKFQMYQISYVSMYQIGWVKFQNFIFNIFFKISIIFSKYNFMVKFKNVLLNRDVKIHMCENYLWIQDSCKFQN